VLNGLEEIPWDRLGHAYGQASDVPGLLRELAEGNDKALNALFGNIWHQGTVYEATSYAVPFLIELLEAPEADITGLLGLLSAIAESSAPSDTLADAQPPSTRRQAEHWGERLESLLASRRAAFSAVAAGMPVYLRFLLDPAEGVRAWAAYLLGLTVGSADPCIQVMVGRVDSEPSPHVRASLILAVGAANAAGEAAALWLRDPEPFPRLAAALVLVDVDGGPSGTVTAILARDAPRSLQELRNCPWCIAHGEPMQWLLERLADRLELQVELLGAWMQDESADVRGQAVFAAEEPIRAWRAAPALLVADLARCLSDPDADVRRWAAHALAGAGKAASQVADDLWNVIQHQPVARATPAASALEALCRLQDRRAAGYLLQHLSADPVDLSTVQEFIEFIGPWADRCREPLLRFLPVAPQGRVRNTVITTLGRLCARTEHASELAQLLRDQCGSHPRAAAGVLSDLGPAAVAALPELRALLEHEDPSVRINAARALWRITGDPAPVLQVLHAAIDDPAPRSGRQQALEVLADLGREGAGLADRLPELMASTDDWVAIRAAIAYWHLTADPDPVVPVLLPYIGTSPRGRLALRGLTDLGPAAHPAVPALREAVNSPDRQNTIGVEKSWVWDDEDYREACAQALDHIT
jgi:HEAT repeat protein